MTDGSFSFTHFPRLETPRLVLRQLVPEDSQAIFRIFSDEQVVAFYDLEQMTTPEQALALIHRQNERFEKRQGLRWGIAQKENDLVIGTCGLYLQAHSRGEIGYDLARAYWRRGYMTEALTAVLRFAFDQINLNRIEAHVMPGNIASDRLLEKLGFQEEGVLRSYAFFKGRYHDLKSFSLLRT